MAGDEIGLGYFVIWMGNRNVSSIAQQSLRSAVDGGLRLDAVIFCLDALQKFRDLGDARTRSIVYEIFMLGRSGLDINDPSKTYPLSSLPGTFSARFRHCGWFRLYIPGFS